MRYTFSNYNFIFYLFFLLLRYSIKEIIGSINKMSSSESDYYTKAENYQIEFNKSLKQCVDKFKELFDDSLKLTCVCAPGMCFLSNFFIKSASKSLISIV